VVIFPALILALALGWIVWHVTVWRSVRDQERDEEEKQFQWRRFRRRMQASSMLALVAIGMGAGLHVPLAREPSLFVYVWSGVFLLTLWIVVLALADALATRAHAMRVRQDHLVAHDRLKAELEKFLERGDS
jgi:Na+/H+ antiporter NhaD/arsenite permease-like protein